VKQSKRELNIRFILEQKLTLWCMNFM
jgi:hypothetical protein